MNKSLNIIKVFLKRLVFIPAILNVLFDRQIVTWVLPLKKIRKP